MGKSPTLSGRGALKDGTISQLANIGEQNVQHTSHRAVRGERIQLNKGQTGRSAEDVEQRKRITHPGRNKGGKSKSRIGGTEEEAGGQGATGVARKEEEEEWEVLGT